MRYVIAIDQGTTGSRAIAYDRSGRAAVSAYREFPQHFPAPGWVEHDPEDIWRSVDSCLQFVLKRIPASSVVAIGITNQRETTVVWDRVSGRPVYNAIVWQCRRTASRCGHIRADRKLRTLIASRTGLPVDAYFSASKIEWILDNVKGARRLAKEGRLAFGTTDSWVLYNLTGGKVHATDYTNASRTMLFNIQTLSWDPQLLELFSVPARMLPQVKPSCGEFGKTCRRGALAQGIPVCGIAGDQQAALFGQAGFRPGALKNTYGTGAFMLLNTGSEKPVSTHGLVTTLGCSTDSRPCYCLEGSIFVAGSAIQWLRDGLRIMERSADSGPMACSLKGNDGVYFVPALTGMGAPYWDQECRGAIFGITRGTRREHIARAALEAMCYQTRDVLEAMQKDSGMKAVRLAVDGGASANDFLCRFQADILGIPVERPQVLETTSLGAAYLAGLYAGYWKDPAEVARCRRIDKVFTPSMPAKTRACLYEGWRSAVRRTLSSA